MYSRKAPQFRTMIFITSLDVIQLRGNIKIAAVCKRWQHYFFNLIHYEISNIDTYCLNTRLEAKSKKGPRNHFRGDGILEDVTHASSLV